MRKLIAFFVDRSLVVNLLTVMVCIFGIVAAANTTRAFLPPMSSRSITVQAMLPGASAVDVERFVSFRLEEALQGLEGLDELTSTTVNGAASLRLKFKASHDDMSGSLERVRSRLGAIQHRLPEDLRPLIVQEDRLTSMPLMDLLVLGVDHQDPQHRRAVEAMAERLRRVPQVVDVVVGLQDMDLYVTFDRAALDRSGVAVTQARLRLLEHLSYAPVGEITVVDEQVAVELDKPFASLDDLRALPLVVNRAGRGITLGEVAQVAFGMDDELVRHTMDGASFVPLEVAIDVDADTIELSKKVRALVDEELGADLPAPLSLRLGQDASDFIAHELEVLSVNGLGGVAIVLLVLLVFLGWRASLMTALGLPFVYLGTVVALGFFGVNFNLISLVALILVVGILVDDAIIVSEAFCAELRRGLAPREAAIEAVMRVAKPVVGMVTTTVVAFSPLLFLKGDASDLLRPLPIVIVLTLLLSLVESFLILPNHLRDWMKPGSRVGDRGFVRAARRVYGKLLGWSLSLRYLSILAVLGLFALAGFLLGTGKVPFEGNLSLGNKVQVYAELPESVSLEHLQQQLRPVEALVAELPEELLDYYTTTLGEVEVGRSTLRGFKYAAISVVPRGTMVEAEEKAPLIIEHLEQRLAALAAEQGLEEGQAPWGFTKLHVVRSSQDPSEQRDVVTVYVSGGDRIGFTAIQDRIREAIRSVEQVKDIFMDEARFQRALRFRPDEAAVLSYGLTTSQLSAQLREHFARQELTRVRFHGQEVEVFTGFADPADLQRATLEQLTVMGPRAVAIPLRFLGRWEESQVLRRIEHQDMLRAFQVDVLYDAEQIESEAVADGVEVSLEPVREEFPGYHISVSPGEKEQRMKAWAIQLGVTCVGLIFLCLALSLGSLVQPVVVLFAIPFGLTGAVLALWAHDMPLALMAVIGVVGLAGVVVNDSLVMTTTINDLRRQDPQRSAREAVLEGAQRRFQAVVLTSLTTLGGVLPLAYGFGGEAGWIQPMVFALGWGLLFATLLTLFFLPCLVLILDDLGRLARWCWRLLSWPLRRLGGA